MCVCYKVTVRDRIISVTEEPLWLSGSLSGGRRKRQLSHSYNGFGLCDSVTKDEPRDLASWDTSALPLWSTRCRSGSQLLTAAWATKQR